MGMYPQVFFAFQMRQNRIRQVAETDLKSCVIVYQLRYVVPDTP